MAIALDDVNLASGAVGKQGDLPGALVPAHCCGTTVERFDKDDGLVARLGNPFGIPRNSVIILISDLLDSGIFIGILFFRS